MAKFLFIFGYETPGLKESNQRLGTDFENSEALAITAETQDQAEQWGIKVADEFLRILYQNPSKKLSDEYSYKIYLFDNYPWQKPEDKNQVLTINYEEKPDLKNRIRYRHPDEFKNF